MSNSAIHCLIEPARNVPSNVAIKYEERTISYSSLFQAAQAVRAALNRVCDRDIQHVGIFLEKCPEAIASIYGVLLSGRTYVPLDIKSPTSRIAYILKDCGIRTLITSPAQHEKLVSTIGEYDGTFNIIVLRDKDAPRSAPAETSCVLNPWVRHSDSAPKDLGHKAPHPNIAAILYTSGSTGMPKGVELRHDAIHVFIGWAHRYFGYKSEDKCISHAPLHFDLSLLDIFASHSACATCVLVPDRSSGNPQALNKLVADEEISIWQSVPSALALMNKYGNIAHYDLRCVRHVCFAGETLSTAVLKQLGQHFTQAVFHNIYGATETNDTFIFSLADIATIEENEPLPIGAPLPYVEYRIVDNEGRSGPDVAKGELLVRTPTMMRGYKNNVRMTEKDFFQTKDIVRRRADGNMVFCGRVDDIVKTNGYRVNLSEVQNALQAHDEIVEVAVIPVNDDDIGKRIVAVICIKPDSQAVSIDLRNHCATHLPRYAIPHAFDISRTRLPKTSSGKIDKRSLIASRS